MHSDIDTATRAWEVDGFAILPSYIPSADLASAASELPILFPTAEEYHDRVDPERNQRFADEFGGIDDFPFASPQLSLLAVHTVLIDLAQRLLGTADLRAYSI